jgi:hypothetical protein
MIWVALSVALLILVLPIAVMIGLWALEKQEMEDIDWRDDD